MPTPAIRPILAADGIFNVRDLGGLPADDGLVVRERMVLRADALQRCTPAAAHVLHDYGVRRVIDLRDDRERDAEGSFVPVDGMDVDVVHLPVLDPTYEWDVLDVERRELLAHRYGDILRTFGGRFVDALDAIASADGGVAYHCAVGKDRTGLVTMLLLGLLGTPHDAIVADYARSARATAVQVSWLRWRGLPFGDVDDEELASGVWSARAETAVATLERVEREHGGVEAFLRGAGMGEATVATLRERLLVRPAAGSS